MDCVLRRAQSDGMDGWNPGHYFEYSLYSDGNKHYQILFQASLLPVMCMIAIPHAVCKDHWGVIYNNLTLVGSLVT